MSFVRRIPFTLVLVAVLVIVAIVARSPHVVLAILAAAVGVAAAERLMGTWRTVVAFVVTGVVGQVVGVGAVWLGALAGEYWAHAVRSSMVLDPLTPILGAVAAGSAFATVLWRRRIRFVVVSLVVVFLLYSGDPADLYRLIAVLVGLGLGALFARQRVTLERWTSSHHETRVLLAVVSVVFALGPLVTLTARGRFGLLSPLGLFLADDLPGSGHQACSVAGPLADCRNQLVSHPALGISALVLALIPLVIVLIGAYGLVRGRRAAVYVIAFVAAADGVLAAFYFGVVPALGAASRLTARLSQTPEFTLWIVANVALPIAFAVLLLSQRRRFPGRVTPRARRRFAITVSVAAVVVTGGYVLLGTLLAAHFRPVVGPLDLLADLPERFIPVSFLDAERRDFVPTSFDTRLLYHGVGPLFWIVVLVALVMVLGRARSAAANSESALAFRRLARADGGSMSFPGTWAGNDYWFDATGRTAIAYRVVNGCAVTVGEPVGRSDDHRETLAEFARFCDSNAWTVVFYSIHDEWAEVLAELGWSTTVIAEETIIDPEGWDLTGKKRQDIRSSVNRAAREGVSVVWGNWQSLSPRTTNQIAEISELWVVEKKLPELGFTLGGLDELRDPDVQLGVAVDTAGTVQAVTSWMPAYRDGRLIGRTLDFMRRRADGMNGVMEFVIADAAFRAQAEELEFLSLSGAPLAVAPSEDKPSPLDRVLSTIGASLEPVYGFRSLLKFKQKFQPTLKPLHLAYSDALALPSIAVAISRCYLPELTLRESAALVRSLR